MNNGHSYLIKQKDRVFKAHPLRTEEVPAILEFMSAVKFNAENYKELLGIGCESQFRKQGALLETSESFLLDAANHPEKYTSIGIWNEEGEPEAFNIVENEDIENMISPQGLIAREGFEIECEELYSAKLAHTLSYRGDMRVKPNSKVKKCFFVLFYLLMKDLVDKGLKYCASEVFNITGYYENNEWHDIDVYNERSFKAQVKGTNAKYIADSPLKEMELSNGIRIRYYSKILKYDFCAYYQLIENEIKPLNLVIEEE